MLKLTLALIYYTQLHYCVIVSLIRMKYEYLFYFQTTTAQGKGRQFLRMAMHHKVLSVPIEILTEDLLYQEVNTHLSKTILLSFI